MQVHLVDGHATVVVPAGAGVVLVLWIVSVDEFFFGKVYKPRYWISLTTKLSIDFKK